MTLSNDGWCGLASDSAAYTIAKQTDWTSNKYASFEADAVEGRKAEDLFKEVIELNDGRSVQLVDCYIEGTKATVEYEIIKEIKKDD